jgi:hypothetical protein
MGARRLTAHAQLEATARDVIAASWAGSAVAFMAALLGWNLRPGRCDRKATDLEIHRCSAQRLCGRKRLQLYFIPKLGDASLVAC